VVLAWRMVKTSRVSTAFDGEGARLHGGRWNSPGVRAVYTSESRALAVLEVMAGLGGTHVLRTYSLVPISIREASVEELTPSTLPRGWDARPPGTASQALGDAWLAAARSAVLRVPSVIIPTEHNYVLNPAHKDFASIGIGRPETITIDPRLRRP